MVHLDQDWKFLLTKNFIFILQVHKFMAMLSPGKKLKIFLKGILFVENHLFTFLK